MTDKFLKHAVYNFMFIYFPGSPLGVRGFFWQRKPLQLPQTMWWTGPRTLGENCA
jgi:hypothetical protein